VVVVECQACGDVYETTLPLVAVRRIARCRRCRRRALVVRVVDDTTEHREHGGGSQGHA
jgi:hypothetical protein